tara:strand:+ start:40 stop:660 length:621 start_codon:yes stop_codon:yes gene_type:complete
MGASSSGGGAGGNTGADAGFFISQEKKKSKLSKKNQALVDASFDDRGKVKIDQAVKTPTLAILSGPLKAGSKVTRNFFTDKVLGSKNYKGTSKADFEAMSVSQQEQIYGDYMSGRQSGRTDAYGNPISSGGRDDNNNQPAQPVIVKKNIGGTEVQTTEAKLAEEKEIDDAYDMRKTKRRGRRQTILTSQTGARGNLVLGKPSLLGA